MKESKEFNVPVDGPLVSAEKPKREKPSAGTAEYFALGLREVERKIKVAIRAQAKAEKARTDLEQERDGLLERYQAALRA